MVKVTVFQLIPFTTPPCSYEWHSVHTSGLTCYTWQVNLNFWLTLYHNSMQVCDCANLNRMTQRLWFLICHMTPLYYSLKSLIVQFQYIDLKQDDFFFNEAQFYVQSMHFWAFIKHIFQKISLFLNEEHPWGKVSTKWIETKQDNHCNRSSMRHSFKATK